MRNRLTLAAALALSLSVGACDRDAPPTAPDTQQPELKKGDRAALLTNVPVTGVADDIRTTAVEAAPFSGTLTVTEFKYENGQLFVRGIVNGVDDFDWTEAELTRQGPTTAPVCDILTLRIGRIFLDLLGLQVDIAPIAIDIRGVTGPGNLLGNLLCALAGLLDPPGPLAAILDLIDRINRILAGL
jgi:hypothetical protein